MADDGSVPSDPSACHGNVRRPSGGAELRLAASSAQIDDLLIHQQFRYLHAGLADELAETLAPPAEQFGEGGTSCTGRLVQILVA